MHRQVKGYQVGGVDSLGIQPINRKIQAAHLRPGLVQPGRRRGQTKGLPAHFIGGNQ
jgi:hypothetical protein